MATIAPNAAIIAIGNELTTGSITDTNTSYLAAELGRAGIRVRRGSIVEDEIQRITAELAAASAWADMIITTGGLGPTTDDLTREAIAAACGVQLYRSEDSIGRMKALFERRGRPFAAINERQAYFPVGSEVIPNSAGTADAFISSYPSGSRIIPVISLPGVPREMKQLMKEYVIPWLSRRFPQAAADVFAHMRCFGLSESYIGGLIEQAGLPAGVTTAYRPTFPEILLSFRAPAGKDGQALVEAARETARGAIGAEYLFTDDPAQTLPARVVQILTEQNETIAAAESCTGGMIVDKLIGIPGASQAVLAGVVCYSNQAKQVFLGVKPLVLETNGAVSRQVAEQMAEHARVRCGATIGISTTGIAGPDGATETKPIGTVWIGLARDKFGINSAADPLLSEAGRRVETIQLVYPAEREMFRNYISAFALDLIRRSLLGYSLSYEKR